MNVVSNYYFLINIYIVIITYLHYSLVLINVTISYNDPIEKWICQFVANETRSLNHSHSTIEEAYSIWSLNPQDLELFEKHCKYNNLSHGHNARLHTMDPFLCAIVSTVMKLITSILWLLQKVVVFLNIEDFMSTSHEHIIA